MTIPLHDDPERHLPPHHAPLPELGEIAPATISQATFLEVQGNVTIGMLMGLAQFVTTFVITWLYIRHANRNLDPIAASLRASMEAGRP